MMKYNTRKMSLSQKIANTKFNFAGNLKYFLIAPLAIALVGLILLFTVGFNKGIDFTGGTILNLVLGDDLNNQAYYTEAITKIDDVIEENGLKVSLYQLNETDSGLALSIRYQDKKGLSEEEMNDLNEKVREELLVKFGLDPNNDEDAQKIQDSQRIGATTSAELLTNAFLSLLVVVAAILVYIGFRFELTSGMAAILALFHDVIIMGALVLIFRIQINSSFIAALITIVGYSINNTIIIFDRIRELSKSELYEKAPNQVIANTAIKDTLTRSIYTTITTFVTILCVAILGVPSIQEFALPIIFGLLAGAYSSIFIAPGLWAIAYTKKKTKKQNVTQ